MYQPTETYDEVAAMLNAQLRPGDIHGIRTRYQSALEAKQAIAQATKYQEKMAAVASYGGEIKRWHKLLIQHCTHIALRDRVVSRANVRHWQQAVFGKSMASSELRMYADSTRSAGEKVKSLLPNLSSEPLDEASCQAQLFYQKYRDALKEKVATAA